MEPFQRINFLQSTQEPGPAAEAYLLSQVPSQEQKKNFVHTWNPPVLTGEKQLAAYKPALKSLGMLNQMQIPGAISWT